MPNEQTSKLYNACDEAIIEFMIKEGPNGLADGINGALSVLGTLTARTLGMLPLKERTALQERFVYGITEQAKTYGGSIGTIEQEFGKAEYIFND